MQLEGSLDFLLKKMENLWIELNYPPAHVIIYLDNTNPVSKNDSTLLANQIVNYIKDYIPREGQVFYSEEDMLINPDKLKFFKIERIFKYDQIIFNYFDHIWSPNLTTFEIQNVIDKKEIKRERIYQKNCDVIWLLIVLYSGKASGNFIIPQEVLEHQYFSHFNKVFLFDAVPKKFWELIID